MAVGPLAAGAVVHAPHGELVARGPHAAGVVDRVWRSLFGIRDVVRSSDLARAPSVAFGGSAEGRRWRGPRPVNFGPLSGEPCSRPRLERRLQHSGCFWEGQYWASRL